MKSSKTVKAVFEHWNSLQSDRTRVKEKAGTLRIPKRLIGTYQQIVVKIHRDERLLAMVEMALASAAWRQRTPTFDATVFFTRFGDTVRPDWRSVGVLVEPKLYPPGVFVVKRQDIQDRRNSNATQISIFAAQEFHFRLWYERHLLQYDHFGFRRDHQ